jgi:hypothetical protein
VKNLYDLWQDMPYGWRVGILVVIAVILLVGPLELILRLVAPRFACSKWVMKLPTLSKQNRLLFNAVLCSTVGIAGIIILLFHREAELGAWVAISMISLVFLGLGVTEFLYWEKCRKEIRDDERQPPQTIDPS